MVNILKKIFMVIVGIFLLLIILLGAYFLFPSKQKYAQKEYLLIFRPTYAQELGLDWQKTFSDILTEMPADKIKISVNWNTIEKQKDVYDYTDLDWMVNEAEQHNKQLILAIGQKTPGWPECHLPLWAESLNKDSLKEQILELNENIVSRYKDNKTVYAWQVENEGLFRIFGHCPYLGRDFLKAEIAKVTELDGHDRPVFTSDSGELSTWLKTGSTTPVLGVSLYRTVWNKMIGYFRWPLTPKLYRRKADLAMLLLPKLEKVWITEYQLEPWSDKPLVKTPLDQQDKALNIERFEKDLDFASRLDFEKIFLWGVEWWYWQKQIIGNDAYWQAAKKFLRDNNQYN